MITTQKTTTTEEVEISNGFYKNSYKSYHVTDTHVLVLSIFGDMVSVTIGYSAPVSDLLDAEPITRDEFMAAYEKAINYMNEKIGLAL